MKVEKLSEEELLTKASECLNEGFIIGWFQGRSEFGPRALGNRSILADPRTKEMKDKINARIKHRESFRPFAPAVLEEEAENYFETSRPLPFMTFVVPVKKEKASQIEAVVHHDLTARVQTVKKRHNPLFYDLIQRFSQKSGVPMVLNTSFNDNGEPIVNTPEDALKSFFRTNLALFLGPHYITKA